MALVTLARHAMATRFELVLYGERPVALRAAGEEALEEITRLEAQLSLFRPESEIANLNARAAAAPVRVTPLTFALLERAARWCRATDGAFDITVAPLMRCWGFHGGEGRRPSPAELEEARACVGMELVELNPRDSTVRFARAGVRLDLGAIGKGFAIEQAVGILRENGVTSALLHGGTSTTYALGHPPDAEAWQVAVVHPRHKAAPDSDGQGRGQSVLSGLPGQLQAGDEPSPPLLATVPLRDEALSVSAVWGRSFEADGQTFGHVMDPRTGQPAKAALLAAVVLPSATDSDALSTALLARSFAGHAAIAGLVPGMRTLVVAEEAGELRIEAKGISPRDLSKL